MNSGSHPGFRIQMGEQVDFHSLHSPRGVDNEVVWKTVLDVKTRHKTPAVRVGTTPFTEPDVHSRPYLFIQSETTQRCEKGVPKSMSLPNLSSV